MDTQQCPEDCSPAQIQVAHSGDLNYFADSVVLTRPHCLQKELRHLVHVQPSAVRDPIKVCALGMSVPPWALPLWNPGFQHATHCSNLLQSSHL